MAAKQVRIRCSGVNYRQGFVEVSARIHEDMINLETWIEPKYLRSTSTRMGSHIARREFENYGLLKFPFVALARLAKTILVCVPQLLLAKLSGDKEAILERNCYWWMWKGYLVSAFRFMTRKEESTDPLSFRNERQFASE